MMYGKLIGPEMFDYEVDNAIFKGGYLKTAPQPYSRHLSRSLYRRYLLFELATLRGKCSRLAWMLHACMELYEFGIENETGFAAKARDLSRSSTYMAKPANETT